MKSTPHKNNERIRMAKVNALPLAALGDFVRELQLHNGVTPQGGDIRGRGRFAERADLCRFHFE